MKTFHMKTCFIENEKWCPAFDDSSTHRECGTCIVLFAPEGANVSLSSKLEFVYSNSEASIKT